MGWNNPEEAAGHSALLPGVVISMKSPLVFMHVISQPLEEELEEPPEEAPEEELEDDMQVLFPVHVPTHEGTCKQILSVVKQKPTMH